MKTLLQFAIGTLVLVAIVVAGCNKYEPVHKPNNQDPLSSRMGKTFTYADTVVGSASIIIEENLNHDFGDAKYNFGDIVIDTAEYSFRVSGLTHDAVDALTDGEQEMIRDSLNDWIERYPNRIDTSGMSGHAIILADLHSVETDYSGSEPTLSLKLHLIIGVDAPASLGCDDWYEFSEDWSIITDNGWCDQNDPDNPHASDAFAEMTRKLNNYRSNTSCHPSCENGAYYYDIQLATKTFDTPDNLDNPNDVVKDGWLDYLLWTDKHDPNKPVSCLSATELGFYTENSYDVAFDYNPFTNRTPYTFRASPIYILALGFQFEYLEIWYAKMECR